MSQSVPVKFLPGGGAYIINNTPDWNLDNAISIPKGQNTPWSVPCDGWIVVHVITVNPDTGEDVPGIAYGNMTDTTIVTANGIAMHTAIACFGDYTDTQCGVFPVAKGDKVTYHNEKQVQLYNDPPTGVTPEPVVVNGITYYKYVEGGGQSSPAKVRVDGVDIDLYATTINDRPIIRPAMTFFPCKA